MAADQGRYAEADVQDGGVDAAESRPWADGGNGVDGGGAAMDDAWPTEAEMNQAVDAARLQAGTDNLDETLDYDDPATMSPREARAVAAIDGLHRDLAKMPDLPDSERARVLGAALTEFGQATFDSGRPVIAMTPVESREETDWANFQEVRGIFGRGSQGEVTFIDPETASPTTVTGNLRAASDPSTPEGMGGLWVMPSDGNPNQGVPASLLVMIKPLQPEPESGHG